MFMNRKTKKWFIVLIIIIFLFNAFSIIPSARNLFTEDQTISDTGIIKKIERKINIRDENFIIEVEEGIEFLGKIYKRYKPVNLQEEFKEEGLLVEFSAEIDIKEILTIEGICSLLIKVLPVNITYIKKIEIVPEKTVLNLDEIPETPRDFLTCFLSESYIREHFKFYTIDDCLTKHNLLYIQLEYDSYTIGGAEIQWDIPIYDGKIRYKGPSEEYDILVNEEEARQNFIDEGCDTSNLHLTLKKEKNETTPPNAYEGSWFCYLAWSAGGQMINENCCKDTYWLNAENGEIEMREGGCVYPN